MLETSSLYSGYGKIKVLFDINFKAEEKEITVVVGPNGAGKTTLLNSVMGLATIHNGNILFEGKKLNGLQAYKIARMGIAYLPQMGNVLSELTVEENLKIASYLLPTSEVKSRMKEILDMFPVLRDFINRKAGTLSGGERRMLAIGMALMRRPKILLLDEMSTDLAPIMVKRVMEKVVQLRDELGLTIVMVEQAARKALEIGDRAYLLVSGTMRFEGSAQELLHHPELAKIYLGIAQT
ncbi:MAG: ABC transporter ATP-binding protein [Aigarchaeota archaeon]|nr:ABC transporter ATP-binding protein [Aigarchaeota archaeon]MCX8192954.1 ABC transporter ATP-binding protein [Nitrososphaeria archaeon]